MNNKKELKYGTYRVSETALQKKEGKNTASDMQFFILTNQAEYIRLLES